LSEGKAIEEITEALAKALEGNKDEWAKATQPMKTDITTKKGNLDKLISHPKPSTTADKKLKGFKTDTFLDQLYLDENQKPLNGIPISGQVGITGLPSSGKSILVEEIAIKVANRGAKVLLITSEDSWDSPSPRFDLQARLKQKAKLLEIKWEDVIGNLFVMDTITHTELRNWNILCEAYRYIIEKEGIELVLIDSVTLLETYRGALKLRLQELSRYNQIHGITALFINQRATEDWDTRNMAGGIGLGHVLDSSLIVDYGRVYHTNIKEDLDLKRGVDVRIVRVLGCRLCGYNGQYQRVTITSDGFLRLYQEPEQS